MKNLSPSLNEVATIPSWGFTVKNTWFKGPKISSTFPTTDYIRNKRQNPRSMGREIGASESCARGSAGPSCALIPQ